MSIKNKQVGKCSTGMQQRLKFAIMLSINSDIWLLDEPCSNLDESGKNLFLDEIKNAAKLNKLVLLATNDDDEAGTADEIIHLPII